MLSVARLELCFGEEPDKEGCHGAAPADISLVLRRVHLG